MKFKTQSDIVRSIMESFERSRSERASHYSDSEVRHLVRRFLVSELLFLYAHGERLTPEARMFIRKAVRHLYYKDAWDRHMRGEVQDRELQGMILQSGFHEPGGADSSGGIIGGKIPKKIGPFLVVEIKAEENIVTQDGKFSIRKGETYLELHAPSVDPEEISLGQIRGALSSVTEYIQTEGLSPKYVLGVAVTTEGKRIGRVAERMGFHVSSLSLPSAVYNQLGQLNQRIAREGITEESIGFPELIYQDTNSFMQKFPPV